MLDIRPIFARLGISCLAICIFATAALAQTLSLKAPSLANENGALIARFGVVVEDEPILKGELEDGAELTLKCEVELHEKNEYWLDRKIASTTFLSTLNFDALEKEFTMTLPGRDTLLRNSDLGALLDNGWTIIKATLGPWSMLERGRTYSLMLDTSMNEADAPEGITRFIYFWSWDTGANNSFQLDFTY